MERMVQVCRVVTIFSGISVVILANRGAGLWPTLILGGIFFSSLLARALLEILDWSDRESDNPEWSGK